MTPSPFTVVALIAARNEADIVQQVVGDLIRQGVSVYFMDDSSDDGTVAAVEPFLGRGVIAIEHLAESIGASTSKGFEWERILERKATLAHTLDADWFIHHDADEFRESPWFGETLRDAIQRVDGFGYNAIDSTRFDFWPTSDDYRPGDDVRQALPFYSEPAPYNRLQIRCWKKTEARVDLASSGGHEVKFAGRRVFPVRFILRHYAIRGQQHGQHKIAERRSRFLSAERDRGWHVQYDDVDEHRCLIREPSTLARFDATAVRLALLLNHDHLQVLEDERAALRNEVAQLREALSERASQVASANAEHRRLKGEIDEAKAAIQHLSNVHDDAQARLEELYRSFSWRCTAPARALYRILRGVVRG